MLDCAGQVNVPLNGRFDEDKSVKTDVNEVGYMDNNLTYATPGSYMTLPLNLTHSGNQDPPVAGQRRTMEANLSIIHNTAHCSGMVHLIIRLCLAK